ncbi:hypothetical protein BH24CHL4_BH24CHL4_24250 [soil metagenome]
MTVYAPQQVQHHGAEPVHIVQFYETDAFLTATVAEFIGSALHDGGAGVVIATEAHLSEIEMLLVASGTGVDEMIAARRYVPLDAASTLAGLMVDKLPDRDRFERLTSGVVANLQLHGGRVHFFGEMTSLLEDDRNHAAAMLLEQFWSDLQRRVSFSLLCAFPADRWNSEASAALHGEICSSHSHVRPAESYALLSTVDERLRVIAELQQKALWLETEIAVRKKSEEQVLVLLAAERTALVAAEAAIQVRDTFIAIAAHDLRTPLTSLSAQVQLSLRRLRRDGRLDPEQAGDALESISAQSGKLVRLINNLLDISQLDGGKPLLAPHQVDLVALVEQAVVEARGRSNHQAIHVESPPRCEAVVDPLRMDQVLANLLDNAVRYSPADSPIEVTLFETGQGVVALSVRDFGQGVSSQHRERIFERFYQAGETGVIGGKSGMGLGLYISREIVELHGGDINAEFPEDGGTRIIVRLPASGSIANRLAETIEADRPYRPDGDASEVDPSSIHH